LKESLVTDDLPLTAPSAKGAWEENASFWVQIIRDHRDRYRTELTDPAILNAIGECAGLDMLDVGCGEGYLARELAGRGAAQVQGLDRSTRLIAAAQAISTPKVVFSEGDANDLPFSDSSFDLVVANHLLNDLPEIARPVREIARVLRPGGRFVTLILHPCFYGDRAEQKVVDIGVSDYFTPRAVEQTFQVDGLESPAPSVSWVRPLEAYTGAMASAGLHITGLTEPHPTEAQLIASPWWQENFPAPLFAIFAAVKPKH
jgi:SAM-dependent methyltransferase